MLEMYRVPLLSIVIAVCLTLFFIGMRMNLKTLAGAIVRAAQNLSSENSNFELMREHYVQQSGERKKLLESYPEKGYGLLYNLLVPEVFCSELERIGNIGDGGKWICNIHNMPREENCAVFSLGINNEMSFDIAFQTATNQQCRIYGFDKSQQSKNILKRFSEVNGSFKVALLGNVSDPQANSYTLEDLLQLYNLKRVEILKIDIEGAEFAVMPSVISAKKICQILIEIHGDPKGVIKLLKLFGANGYYLFSYEINGYHSNLCEYAFIHESCFESYKVQVLAQYLA